MLLLLLALALPTVPALAQQSPYRWYGRGYTGTGYFPINYSAYIAPGATYPYGWGNPGYPYVPYGYLDPLFGPYVYGSYGFPYFGYGPAPYGYYDPLYGPYVYGGYTGMTTPSTTFGVLGP